MRPQLGYQNSRLRRRLISKQRVIMLGPILLAVSIFPGNKVGPPIIGGGEPAFPREWLHPWIKWIHQSWEPSMAWHVSPTCVLGDREGAKRTREYTNKTEITTAIFSRLASHYLSHSSGEPPGAPFLNVLRYVTSRVPEAWELELLSPASPWPPESPWHLCHLAFCSVEQPPQLEAVLEANQRGRPLSVNTDLRKPVHSTSGSQPYMHIRITCGASSHT